MRIIAKFLKYKDGSFCRVLRGFQSPENQIYVEFPDGHCEHILRADTYPGSYVKIRKTGEIIKYLGIEWENPQADSACYRVEFADKTIGFFQAIELV